jgi:hypothetical protein
MSSDSRSDDFFKNLFNCFTNRGTNFFVKLNKNRNNTSIGNQSYDRSMQHTGSTVGQTRKNQGQDSDGKLRVESTLAEINAVRQTDSSHHKGIGAYLKAPESQNLLSRAKTPREATFTTVSTSSKTNHRSRANSSPYRILLQTQPSPLPIERTKDNGFLDQS